MDYEKDCKRCGKCCSPGIYFRGEWVRAKDFKCVFLDNNNLCMIYRGRKTYAWCKSPQELGEKVMPEGCAFGGTIREISGIEQANLKANPPAVLIYALQTKYFKWR